MRRLVPVLIAGLLAVSGVVAPSPGVRTAAGASADPKVVLIVGATESTTSSYRAYMDTVYATATQYSANVVKVYSPNATWSAVKAAMQGASIVVYMGHGNGFPSPYLSTLWTDRQDGLGLNAAAGQGDSNNRYYGESFIGTEIRLAPGAVVILAHLCYASGNSEPGQTPPSLTVAKARIDNFAAGFLQAGARAVIADAHSDTAWYLDQLFTTHQTVDQLFRTKPWAAGNTFTFASSRTPGLTAYSDPDVAAPPSGFYRSMVALPALRTDDVTGAAFAVGPVDLAPPAIRDFAVAPAAFNPTLGPGAEISATASEAVDWSVAILGSTGGSVTTLASSGPTLSTTWGGRDAAGQPVPDGTYTVVATASDASGHAPATARGTLVLDGTPPALAPIGLPGEPTLVSPNGDGINDGARVAFSLSEPAAVVATIHDAAGTTVRTIAFAAAAGPGAITWDGRADAGSLVPDGQYVLDVTASDAAGGASPEVTAPIVVATTRSGVAATPAWIAPAARGTDPRVSTLTFALARPATVTWQVTTAAGRPVRTWYRAAPLDAGPHAVRWDGRTDTGALAPSGRYLSQVTVADGTTTTTEQAWVYSGGIRILASDTTPAAGQTVTITLVAVEALRANPSVSVVQPGRARVTYRTVKIGTATYRASIRFAAGPAGAVTVRVSGVDRFGRPAGASIGYRLH